MDNSLGQTTGACLMIGVARAQIPTSYGGTFLVQSVVEIPIGLAPGTNTFPIAIPCSEPWGQIYDLQVIELDPGASHGISFSAGLELQIGI